MKELKNEFITKLKEYKELSDYECDKPSDDSYNKVLEKRKELDKFLDLNDCVLNDIKDKELYYTDKQVNTPCVESITCYGCNDEFTKVYKNNDGFYNCFYCNLFEKYRAVSEYSEVISYDNRQKVIKELISMLKQYSDIENSYFDNLDTLSYCIFYVNAVDGKTRYHLQITDYENEYNDCYFHLRKEYDNGCDSEYVGTFGGINELVTHITKEV